jgi:excisionase family DNA binding protein
VSETTTDDAGLLLYGAPAIAKFLGLTERQVRHRVADGELPTFKIGGTVCARRASLVAWLAKREVEAHAAARAARNARRAANRRAFRSHWHPRPARQCAAGPQGELTRIQPA